MELVIVITKWIQFLCSSLITSVSATIPPHFSEEALPVTGCRLRRDHLGHAQTGRRRGVRFPQYPL